MIAARPRSPVANLFCRPWEGGGARPSTTLDRSAPRRRSRRNNGTGPSRSWRRVCARSGSRRPPLRPPPSIAPIRIGRRGQSTVKAANKQIGPKLHAHRPARRIPRQHRMQVQAVDEKEVAEDGDRGAWRRRTAAARPICPAPTGRLSAVSMATNRISMTACMRPEPGEAGYARTRPAFGPTHQLFTVGAGNQEAAQDEEEVHQHLRVGQEELRTQRSGCR